MNKTLLVILLLPLLVLGLLLSAVSVWVAFTFLPASVVWVAFAVLAVVAVWLILRRTSSGGAVSELSLIGRQTSKDGLL